MIELRRAKMGLPPMTQPTGSAIAAGARPGGVAGSSTSGGLSVPAGSRLAGVGVSPSSQLASAAAMMASEDERMHRFLSLLSASSQETDDPPDAKPPATSSIVGVTTGTSSASPAIRRGPTVPIALSRRILHRQGAGYLDENVAAVASAAADRFLATVLQQAAACRDRRLKGEELAKREKREIRRHRKRRRAEVLERRRKKTEEWKQRKDKNLAAVKEADVHAAAKAAAGSAGSSSKSKSKKSKKTTSQGNGPRIDGVSNGDKVPAIPPMNHDPSDDSVDEEENYYEDYFGEGSDSLDDGDASDDSDDDEDDDEESRYALLLRDVQRPLSAWGVTLTGKIGLGTIDTDVPEEEDDEVQASDIDAGITEGVMPSDSGADDGVSSVVGADATSLSAGDGSSPPTSPAAKAGGSGAASASMSSPEAKKAKTTPKSKSSPKSSSKK